MIPILRESMVKDKRWFDDEEIVEIITICQSLPGVIAINMATYVGFKRQKLLGSLIATIGVVLPSFIIILIVAMGLNHIKDNPFVLGAFGGLRAAAAGMVIVAIYTIGKVAIKDKASAAIAIISFVLIAFFHISIMLIITVLIVFGAIRTYLEIKNRGEES